MNALFFRTSQALVRTAVAMGVATAAAASAQSTVSNLLAGYETVDCVQCDVRRDTESGLQHSRKLSRVAFERPDRLHVENFAPLARKIVCDGTNFFSYVDGDPMGFSRPVAELDEPMLMGLRAVPGTPMEHLLRLQNRPETHVPPKPGFSRCVRIVGPPPQALLAFDDRNRLVRIEIYDHADATNAVASWDYAEFLEPAPGVWIPTVHRAVLQVENGSPVRETARFENYRIGDRLDPTLFDPARHFRSVTFTNSFDAIYK